LDKYIYPMEIIGDETITVSDKFTPFIKSLIHVFNNCVDHGIEDIETRIENGKDEMGTIRCSFEQVADLIILEIGDDGAGVDIEKICEKVIKNGDFTKEEIDLMSEDEKLDFLFYDGISSRDNASVTSGRGMGMSAIKHNVQKIGGKILVQNTKGKGVTFKFMLPLDSQELIQENPDAREIIHCITSQTEIFLKQESKLELLDTKRVELFVVNKHNTIVKLLGDFFGTVLMSFDESIIKHISNYLIPSDFSDEDRQEMIEDMPSELLNTIVGLSISKFPLGLRRITISPPEICRDEQANHMLEKSINKEGIDLITEAGNIKIILVQGEVKC